MPRIKELGGKKNGMVPYIVDSDGGVWGVPEDRINGWLASHPDDTAGDLEEFFTEAMESPAECEVRFHCFSLVPLRLAISVSDEGTELRPDWWME